MGYYMCQIKSEFTIKKENINKAWQVLEELFKKRKIRIRNNQVFHSFEQAMHEWSWDVEINENGDCTSILFYGEKYTGEEKVILEAIAPYVENHSYIQMRGEGMEIWRWIFNNAKVIKQYESLIW